MPRRPAPFSEVFATTPARAARISRDLKAGLIRKIAPRLYTTDRTQPIEALVRRLLWPIASLVFPNAVITDRTAFEAGPSADGSVFLAADAARDVALPGGVVLRASEPEGRRPTSGGYAAVGPLHGQSGARVPRERGPDARWSGKASLLAGPKLIAVVPVLGWWDRRSDMKNRAQPFSLIVSVFADDVYSEIEAALAIPVPVEVG